MRELSLKWSTGEFSGGNLILAPDRFRFSTARGISGPGVSDAGLVLRMTRLQSSNRFRNLSLSMGLAIGRTPTRGVYRRDR